MTIEQTDSDSAHRKAAGRPATVSVRSGLITTDQWVPRPLDEIFAFFSDERNLETLTPPWLRFKVLGKSTEVITDGTEISYRLRLFGVPLTWRSRIQDWRPGRSFVDVQLQGPYAEWHHLHTFVAENEGTRLEDRVQYRVPFGWLGALTGGPFVRLSLTRIFRYRQETIARLFGAPAK